MSDFPYLNDPLPNYKFRVSRDGGKTWIGVATVEGISEVKHETSGVESIRRVVTLSKFLVPGNRDFSDWLAADATSEVIVEVDSQLQFILKNTEAYRLEYAKLDAGANSKLEAILFVDYTELKVSWL